ncbi:hypothetical protein CNR29_07385 [Levilactobacillus brevis]|uniref:DUF4355 domain-containing protein n=1 Tax=Levilactobacillus brevis TaxID=1580 RepID=A0A2A3TYI1_LEVBR|nr:hypothetical protein [Levilactobacillus brevis]PBQ23847.1 hypothetical protein CNR29_07385 [Levilactobacillus brevis]
MKRFNGLMPMQLQFFAENDSTNGDASNDNEANANDDQSTETITEATEKQDIRTDPNDAGSDNDKVIEKLQSRIGKEQSKKNELQQQLEQAQSELKKLRSGDKEDEEKEKSPEQIKVEALEKQLARRDIIDSTLDVFKESHIDMPKNIVSMFVDDDRDKTIENAGELLTFITSVKKDAEAKVRSEYVGGRVPSATKHQESNTNFGIDVAKSGGTNVPLQSKY